MLTSRHFATCSQLDQATLAAIGFPTITARDDRTSASTFRTACRSPVPCAAYPMQSIVTSIAVNCARSISVGFATSRRNVVTAPRPQNENGGPGSVGDGFAGIFAFSAPAPALNANSSE